VPERVRGRDRPRERPRPRHLGGHPGEGQGSSHRWPRHRLHPQEPPGARPPLDRAGQEAIGNLVRPICLGAVGRMGVGHREQKPRVPLHSVEERFLQAVWESCKVMADNIGTAFLRVHIQGRHPDDHGLRNPQGPHPGNSGIPQRRAPAAGSGPPLLRWRPSRNRPTDPAGRRSPAPRAASPLSPMLAPRTLGPQDIDHAEVSRARGPGPRGLSPPGSVHCPPRRTLAGPRPRGP